MAEIKIDMLGPSRTFFKRKYNIFTILLAISPILDSLQIYCLLMLLTLNVSKIQIFSPLEETFLAFHLINNSPGGNNNSDVIAKIKGRST